MIPLIDSRILEDNPKFAVLYASLSKDILNPDGSTKHHPAQKERDAVTASFKKARLRAAKLELLRIAINKIDIRPELKSTTTKPPSRAQSQTPAAPLPPELIELILLLSSRLSVADLPRSKLELLESTPQWQSLPSQIPRIGQLASEALHTQAVFLARIISPTTNPSFVHRTIPSMVEVTTTLQRKTREASVALQKARMDLIPKVIAVSNAYRVAMTTMIHLLESVQHGSSARYIKAKADFARLSAEVLALEAEEKRLRATKMVYSDQARSALGNYMRHLRDATERAGEKERDARRVLWGYGVGREGGEEKERVMKEIARVYGELMKERKDVERDVEKLKGR